MEKIKVLWTEKEKKSYLENKVKQLTSDYNTKKAVLKLKQKDELEMFTEKQTTELTSFETDFDNSVNNIRTKVTEIKEVEYDDPFPPEIEKKKRRRRKSTAFQRGAKSWDEKTYNSILDGLLEGNKISKVAKDLKLQYQTVRNEINLMENDSNGIYKKYKTKIEKYKLLPKKAALKKK